MGYHGIEATSCHIFKTHMLLDFFMKELNGPAKPVCHHDLTSFDSDIITGKVSTSTIRSFFGFGTHQLDLAHVAQVANRMSDAKLHSLGFLAIRHDPDGLPL
jgi:hypothetical protein